MVTITSIVQKITNNTTSPLSNNTIILDDDDNTQLIDDTTIVDKTVATFSSFNRNDQTLNIDNKSTDSNFNNSKESPVNAGLVINEVLLFTLEARDFESSQDDFEDDTRLPIDEFQDFDERNVHQMFSPPVPHTTIHNKDPWSEVASLKKGPRETATINSTSIGTTVLIKDNNNFDVFRDDDSSITAPQQLNTRSSTKPIDSREAHTTRPLSIMTVSNTVHSSVTKLVSLPHLSPSHDPVQEFLPSQELHTVNTPTVSNTTTNTIVTLDDGIKIELNESISFVSSNNSDETYNEDDLSYDSSIVSMSQLLQRTTSDSDSSSDGCDDNSDDNSSYYFEDNKDSMAEWLNANDEQRIKSAHFSLSLKAKYDDDSIASNSNSIVYISSKNDTTANNDVARTNSSVMTTTANLVSILSNTNTNVDINPVPTTHVYLMLLYQQRAHSRVLKPLMIMQPHVLLTTHLEHTVALNPLLLNVRIMIAIPLSLRMTTTLLLMLQIV